MPGAVRMRLGAGEPLPAQAVARTSRCRGSPAPPTNFHAEDDQAAAPSLPQFRVSSVFAVDCLVEGEARLLVSPWARLAIRHWAHDCCIRRDLSEHPGDNLYAASVTC